MSKCRRKVQIRTVRSRLTVVLVAAILCGAIAAGALAQSAGKSTLIGKLEGPEVVTDPARFPKSFSESPQLTALVKAGKLPPVAERIGQDPLVIKPLKEIGKYGGVWRAGLPRPAGLLDGLPRLSGPGHLVFLGLHGGKGRA